MKTNKTYQLNYCKNCYVYNTTSSFIEDGIVNTNYKNRFTLEVILKTQQIPQLLN